MDACDEDLRERLHLHARIESQNGSGERERRRQSKYLVVSMHKDATRFTVSEGRFKVGCAIDCLDLPDGSSLQQRDDSSALHGSQRTTRRPSPPLEPVAKGSTRAI